MKKQTIKLNESQLRNIIKEAVEEAFNNDQYAYMTGAAQGYADNINKWKYMTDPKYRAWADRKKRQAEKFGQAAVGRADSNNYTRGAGSPGGAQTYDLMGGDVYAGYDQSRINQKNGDTNPFMMRRSNYSYDQDGNIRRDANGKSITRPGHGDTWAPHEWRQDSASGKQYGVGDYYDTDQGKLDLNVSTLRSAYNNGRMAAKGQNSATGQAARPFDYYKDSRMLNESQLRNIIKESIKKVLNEE